MAANDAECHVIIQGKLLSIVKANFLTFIVGYSQEQRDAVQMMDFDAGYTDAVNDVHAVKHILPLGSEAWDLDYEGEELIFEDLEEDLACTKGV